jgi:hypothetical protein
MYSNRLLKIAELLKTSKKFNFNYSVESEQKFATLRSAIMKNEGLWKNPNIIHYLKSPYEREDGNESQLEQAIKRHVKPTDLGCVVTSINLNPETFRGKYRIKEDAFIYDEHGVRLHFKVKNNYPEKPYTVTNRDGEKYQKVEVTKKFNSLELVWERSPETQRKIDETPNKDADWFEENKDKVELILSRVPENRFNEKQLSDLKKNKKIDDKQLDRLYDEAVAQGRGSFNDTSEARKQLGLNPQNVKEKSKTTLKIVHVGVKEAPSFRPGGGIDMKSQIIGISDDFKEKVIVKFGLGTRAGEQLAAAIGLPAQKLEINHVGIKTPTAITAHLGSVPCEVIFQDEKQTVLKAEPKSDHSPKWEDAVKEYDALKTGDKVTVSVRALIGKSGSSFYEKEMVILKRNGDEFTFKNIIDDKKLPLEDIHDNEEKMIGKKVTVEGEFKLYNGLVFVTRPKFTKA